MRLKWMLLRCKFRKLFISWLLVLLSLPAWSHTGSTAFIELTQTQNSIDGEWLLALRDLEVAVGLDADQDGNLTWGEIDARRAALNTYARANLQASVDNSICPVMFDEGAPVLLDDLVYWRWPLHIGCANGAQPATLKYSALFNLDTTHRAIVKWRDGAQRSERVLVFSPQQQILPLHAMQSAWSSLALIGVGVRHILEGYDHLLFLMALLVPIIFAKQLSPRAALRDLLKVITAFTVGHSITLAIATLSGWSPPARWVEAAIALTVVLAGINIVRPLFRDASWRMAGAFGLIHGFGFAAALRDLELVRAQLALSLLNFNLGVEAGQLLVVTLVCPLLLALARVQRTAPLLRTGSAWTIVAIGGVWLAQRTVL